VASRIRQARADGVYLGGVSAPPVGKLIRTLRTRLGPRVALIAPGAIGPLDSAYEMVPRRRDRSLFRRQRPRRRPLGRRAQPGGTRVHPRLQRD
jgi:hypothetical protein